MKYLYKATKQFYVLIASLIIGIIFNVAIFFLLAFIFAGANGDEWVKVYFGGDGGYFMMGTIIIAVIAFPFMRKLNVVSNKK